MIHPVQEWRSDPLSAGIFYGTLIEAVAVSILIPAPSIYYATWQLITAAVALVAGIAVIILGIKIAADD